MTVKDTTTGWIDSFDGEVLQGWVASTSPKPEVEILINGLSIGVYECTIERHDLANKFSRHLNCRGFRVSLENKIPTSVWVEVLSSCSKAGLNGSPFLYPTDVQLTVADIQDSSITSNYLFFDPQFFKSIVKSVNKRLEPGLRPLIFQEARASVLYSAKRQPTGLLWDFPQSNQKIVQLNKSRSEFQRVKFFYDNVSGEIPELLVPALLGSAKKGVKHQLFFEFVSPRQSSNAYFTSFTNFMKLVILVEKISSARPRKVKVLFRSGKLIFLKDIIQVLRNQERWKDKLFSLNILFRRMALPRYFSHGDLHTDNIIIEKVTGSLYPIDWTHYKYEKAGYDLATSMRSMGAQTAYKLLLEARSKMNNEMFRLRFYPVLLNLYYLQFIKNTGKEEDKRFAQTLLAQHFTISH